MDKYICSQAMLEDFDFIHGTESIINLIGDNDA